MAQDHSKKSAAENTEIQLLLEHQQLALLYAAIPNSLLASLFGSVVATLIFIQVISPYRIYPWVIMLLLISAYRFHQYRAYKKAAPTPENKDEWFVQFRIGTLLQAFVVGSGGLLLFAFDDSNYQTLLALMIVCMGSFATTTLAPHRPIVVAFLLIAFMPMVLMVYFLETEVTRYISWFLFLLVIMLILSAMRIHKTINDSITLGIEAKYREERLRDYEQRLSMFVEETPLAVLEWDLNQHIIEWNPAAERIFGYQQEEVGTLEAKDLMFVEASTSMQQMWDQVFVNSSGIHSIQENRRRDGTLILCEWINTPLINENEEIIGVISLVQDVTQRIANEKLKNEFVSIVSHELRTPVTSIKAGLGLLHSGILADEKEKSQEMLEIALNNTNRLQMLINDILDVDKLESGKMEYRFSSSKLDKVIFDVINNNESYALQHSVEVSKAAVPADCQVYMDPDRIVQVLTNLLSNAIKFSVKHGVVTISVQKQASGFRVMVNNRGEVIPEADRENMFSKFFQRDSSTTRAKGGTGLGLYISQKILREHGTSLNFESTEQSGTTFFFDLGTEKS